MKLPRPLIYCPVCMEHVFGVFDLIEHVKIPENNCQMTLQRLKDAGVIDDGDLEAYSHSPAHHQT